MRNKEQVRKEIEEVEKSIKPLEAELKQIREVEAKEVDERIILCEKGKAKFELNELRFAATSRCQCGLGFAYPKNIGTFGMWMCSGILLGTANREVLHDRPMPFAFYEVKSEEQPSANGQTTRP